MAEPLIPAELARELQSLARQRGSRASFRSIRSYAAQFERAVAWSRRALSESHLVHVACALIRELGCDELDLEALGVPVDVLDRFPRWRDGDRTGFRPHRLSVRIVPTGAAEPIPEVRMQLSSSAATAPHALALLRDLLRRTDHHLIVVVEPGANISALGELAREFHSSAGDRVRLVQGECASVFPRDNALGATDAEGNPVLLVPRSFRDGQARARDAVRLEDSEAMYGMRAARSALYWDGGNLVADEAHCLLGVDTVAENMHRLGLTRDEVVAMFGAELGSEIVLLGALSRTRFDASGRQLTRSGQPAPHIDLDVSVLGRYGRKRRPRALIADPARGLDFLPAVLAKRALFAGHFLDPARSREVIEAEYVACAQRRHPALLDYCQVLEDLGYVVVGVPDLRLSHRENLFSSVNLNFNYANVLPGLHRGEPAVRYLPYGIRALDTDARARYRAAGVTPRQVSSDPCVGNALMRFGGGLRCFCGQLGRRAQRRSSAHT